MFLKYKNKNTLFIYQYLCVIHERNIHDKIYDGRIVRSLSIYVYCRISHLLSIIFFFSYFCHTDTFSSFSVPVVRITSILFLATQ